MKITRLGHAATLIEGSKTIVIDPFITNNPLASVTLEQLPKIDVILITHDHFDHFGDAIAIATRDQATLVAIHEVSVRKDVTDAKINAVGANIGGTYTQDGISYSLTPAIHSADNGSPCGFVVSIDGKKIYHSGDTFVFTDMKLIPKLFGHLDVALVPIGGHYTMDEKSASLAVEYLKPHVTIPIHYNTWPPIEADTSDFTHLVGEHSRVKVLDPGQSYEL